MLLLVVLFILIFVLWINFINFFVFFIGINAGGGWIILGSLFLFALELGEWNFVFLNIFLDLFKFIVLFYWVGYCFLRSS